MIKIAPTLETNRLRLIHLDDNHLEDIYRIFSNKIGMKYWDDLPHTDIKKSQELLELFTERIEAQTGMSWGITQKSEPSKIIGTVSYNRYKKEGIAEIGYMLLPSYWKNGIMCEALNVFLDYGFKTLEIHRVEALIIPENVASQELVCKLGFQQEGTIRDRNFFKGQYNDLILYSLLSTDPRPKY